MLCALRNTALGKRKLVAIFIWGYTTLLSSVHTFSCDDWRAVRPRVLILGLKLESSLPVILSRSNNNSKQLHSSNCARGDSKPVRSILSEEEARHPPTEYCEAEESACGKVEEWKEGVGNRWPHVLMTDGK